MNESPILAMLEETAAAAPGAVAIARGATELTYAELVDGVRRRAAELAASGAGAGDHVLLVLDNGPEFALHYYATAVLGCTVEAVDPALPEPVLRRHLVDGAPSVLVTTSAHPAAAVAGCAVRAVDVPPGAPAPPLPARRGPVDPDATWVVARSSGSTGEPKRIGRSQPAQVAEADNIATTARLTAGDVILCPVPLHHALGQFCCMLAAARSGAALVLLDDAAGESAVEAVVTALNRREISLLLGVPHLFDALAGLPAPVRVDTASLRMCLSGSNFLDPDVAERFHARFGIRIRQTYGSTETGSVSWDVGDTPSPGTAGTPLHGVTVRIVDDRGREVPAGAAGEVVVRGAAVAGAGEHRTGDLGRVDVDGRLTVLGRTRVLIDTGGRKVNPVEVERVLAAHPRVADAGVVGLPLSGGGALLVAAVVPEAAHGFDGSDVLAHCRRSLTAHEVPQRLQVCTEIPRTAVGKIRRAELAARFDLAATSGGAAELRVLPGVARRARVLDLLRRWLAELTGTDVEHIAPSAPARTCGADSLVAVRLRLAAQDELGVDLSLAEVLGSATVAELAGELADRLDHPASALARGPVAGIFPLSANQLSVWHAEATDLSGSAHVVAVAARIVGECDAEALLRAARRLTARHAVLRTSFPVEGGAPVQRVADTAEVDFAVVEEPAGDLAAAAFAPFDIATGPLLRIRLRTGDPRGPVLVVSQHHLITDHWSTLVLLDELGVLYAAESGGAEVVLPHLSHGYTDFAAWAGGDRAGEALEHWRNRLSPPPPPADLPVPGPRPVVRSHHGSSVRQDLAPDQWSAVRAHADAAGTTPFTVLLTAFHVLLNVHTGRSDSSVGVNAANRDRPEFAGVLGYFANPVVHRVRIAPDHTFSTLLAAVRDILLTDLAHTTTTYEQLLGEVAAPRDRGRTPLVEVGFSQNRAHDTSLAELSELLHPDHDGARVSWGPLTLEALQLDRTAVVYDLAATVVESRGRAALSWEFDTDLFTPDAVRCFAADYAALLEHLLRAPDSALKTATVLSARPAGHAATATGDAVSDAVRARARAAPEKVAVVEGGCALTYRELDERADRAAAELPHSLDGPTEVPGATAAELVAGCLGVLRAGGLALPVRGDDRAAPGGTDVGCPDGGGLLLTTSGVTGRAHRVVVPARMVPRGAPNAAAGDVLLASGDVHRLTAELLPAVAAGATAVVLPDADRIDALAAGRPTGTATLTPTELCRLLAALDESGAAPSLGVLVLTGEVLGADLLRRWWEHAPRTRVIHRYGGVSRGLIAAEGEARPGEEFRGIVPAGLPVPGSELRIVDPMGRCCPRGVPGELCLAVDFAPAPAAPNPGGPAPDGPNPDDIIEVAGPDGSPATPLRRTGDLGVLLADGALVVLGRIVHTRSEHGYHPDPARTEAVLRSAGVRAAAIVDSGADRPTAFVEAPGQVDERRLLDLLRSEVPAHQVPGRIVPVPAIPMAAGGKAARTADAPAPTEDGRTETAMNPLEAVLAETWQDVLGVDEVGLDDDYYALGGDSVLAVRIATKAAERGVRITRRQLFTRPTIRALAAVAVHKDASALVSRSFSRRRSIPLTPVQRWFFELDLPDPGHWNQSVAVRVAESDVPRLRAAVRAAADGHGALQHRFRHGGSGGWEQVFDPTAETVAFEEASAPDGAALSAAVARARRGLDVAAGPLLRATTITAGAERMLVLSAHHLVVDALSWAVLLDDLRAELAGEPGREAERRAVDTSFADWARNSGGALAAQSGADEPPVTLETGTRVEEVLVPADRFEPVAAAVRSVGAHPVDGLLLAVAGAVEEITGRPAPPVVVERHGRDADAQVDLSRTVGWFTVPEPLRVPAGAGVAEVARARLGGGGGAGAGRHWVSVNYLGRLGALFTGGAHDDGLPQLELPWPGDRGPTNPRPFHWEFSGSESDRGLLLRLSHADDPERAGALLALVRSRFAALAAGSDRVGEVR